MANNLPKRMRFSKGKYYFISFDGEWRELGSELSKALERYLSLYGAHCSDEVRDTVTDLYLAIAQR